MTDYFTLSDKMWIRGWLSEPVIYYYADADKTITIKLVDPNGNYVTDATDTPISLTYNAVQGVNEINIGDWLDANKDYFTDGIYALEIDNGSTKFYIAIIISSAGSSIPVPSEEQQYIKKIIVYDKVLGISIELPPNASTIPYIDRYMTLIYLHDDDKKIGRIRIYGYDEDMDTGWARRGIWRLSFSFNSLNDLITFLASHTYPRNYDSETLSAITKIISSYPELAPDILGLYGIMPLFGRSNILGYNVTVDTDNNIYRIDMDIYARIGDLWSDIWGAIGSACAGAAAGAAVGSIVPVLGTATGAVVGGLAGLAIFALSKYFSSTSTTTTSAEKQAVINKANEGKQNVTRIYNDALADLENLHDAGEITDNAYNILKTDIEALYSTSIKAIDEVVDEAVKKIDDAYNSGYDKGVSDSKMWIVGAGMGGLALGILIGRR